MDVTQVQTTATKLFGPTMGADQFTLVGEVGLTYVHDMPKKRNCALTVRALRSAATIPLLQRVCILEKKSQRQPLPMQPPGAIGLWLNLISTTPSAPSPCRHESPGLMTFTARPPAPVAILSTDARRSPWDWVPAIRTNGPPMSVIPSTLAPDATI